ncbi:MAG: hypothetical protein K8R88_09055 [Armatimonadetes bacterium]|nr:hypothetical protein [Armatimonadota bacterium]
MQDQLSHLGSEVLVSIGTLFSSFDMTEAWAKVLGAYSWPLLVVFIVVYLRKPLSELLGKVSSAKVAGSEITFTPVSAAKAALELVAQGRYISIELMGIWLNESQEAQLPFEDINTDFHALSSDQQLDVLMPLHEYFVDRSLLMIGLDYRQVDRNVQVSSPLLHDFVAEGFITFPAVFQRRGNAVLLFICYLEDQPVSLQAAQGTILSSLLLLQVGYGDNTNWTLKVFCVSVTEDEAFLKDQVRTIQVQFREAIEGGRLEVFLLPSDRTFIEKSIHSSLMRQKNMAAQKSAALDLENEDDRV